VLYADQIRFDGLGSNFVVSLQFFLYYDACLYCIVEKLLELRFQYQEQRKSIIRSRSSSTTILGKS